MSANHTAHPATSANLSASVVAAGIIGLKSSGVVGKPLPKPFGNVVWFFPEAFIPTAALVSPASVDGEQTLGEDCGCALERTLRSQWRPSSVSR